MRLLFQAIIMLLQKGFKVLQQGLVNSTHTHQHFSHHTLKDGHIIEATQVIILYSQGEFPQTENRQQKETTTMG